MTHSEKVYLEAKDRMLTDKTIIVTEDFLLEVIRDLFDDIDFMEETHLLKSIHVPALIEDVQEELKEEESKKRDPLAHVGMGMGDFI